MIASRVVYPSRGLDRPAYVARPDDAERPGVLVIHEIFGLSAHMEDVCRRFATQGYAAMAPDLFAHGGRPVSNEELEAAMRFTQSLPPEIRRDAAAARSRISELPEPQRAPTERALEWLQHRDFDAYVPAMEAAVDWLASQPFARRERIGAVGFCMGGALVGRLVAVGAPLAASVIFYGNNPPLDWIPRIRGPVLGLYGGDDRRITDAVPELAEAMRRAGKRFEHHVYPGAGHAFFNDSRPEVFRDAAAEDAWRRVLAFFETTLRA